MVKKYEKKTKIDKNLVEQELKSLWNTELDKKVISDRKRVQNYLLGQTKKKFPDYSFPEVILIIQKFLEEKITTKNEK